jgi:hypothetical protein
MEFLLDLLSNFCQNFAALLILVHTLGPKIWKRKTVEEQDANSLREKEQKEEATIITKDLQIMLALGSISRVYWSCSPPEAWSGEMWVFQQLSKLDVFTSPFIWCAVCYFVAFRQGRAESTQVNFGGEKRSEDSIWSILSSKGVHWMFSWAVWTPAALVLAVICETFVPPSHEGWPFDGVAILFNMLVDGFAMIPQMNFINNSEAKQPSVASHFIGLLCVSRALRMMFWFSVFLIEHIYYGGQGFVWTFVIPDILHTLFMGQFMWVWMKKVKKDTIDPMLAEVTSV